MEHRTICGTEVPPLGMGCWAVGGPFREGSQPLGWGVVDDEESTAALRRAVDLGVADRRRSVAYPRRCGARGFSDAAAAASRGELG